MKKITLWAVLALFFAQVSSAGGHSTPPTPDPGPSAGAVSGSESSATALSAAEARSTARSETVVDASSGSAVAVETGETSQSTDVSVAGDTLDIDGAAVTVEGDQYDAAEIPVSSSYAPIPLATAPCVKTAGFGYQGANGAASLGIPLPNSDCDLRNDAAFLATIGMKLAAAEALCGTKQMRRRFGRGLRAREDQIAACVGHMHKTLRYAADLDALRGQVDALKAELEEKDDMQQEQFRRFEKALQTAAAK